MRTLFLIAVFFYMHMPLCYPERIDTARLVFNSKMIIISDVERYRDKSYYNNFMEFTPSYLFLNKKGFDKRYVFYKIAVYDTLVKNESELNRDSFTRFFTLLSGDVYFAFDDVNQKIYVLSGLRHNDFLLFFNDIVSIYEGMYERKITKDSFAKTFYIQGVNLKCLIGNLEQIPANNCGSEVKPFYLK